MTRLLVVLTCLFVVVPLRAEDPKPAQPPKPAEPVKPAGETKPAEPSAAKKYARLETTQGDIILELDTDVAPKTVENFLRYVSEGFYRGTVFHGVQHDAKKGHLISGGIADQTLETKTAGLHEPIDSEWKPGMKNTRGTIGLFRDVFKFKECSRTMFFINTADNPGAEDLSKDHGGLVVFGRVIRGMDTVDRIAASKLIQHPKYSGFGAVTPDPLVVITDAKEITFADIDKEFHLFKPIGPKLEEPKKEEPKKEEPKKDEPKKEEPKKAAPKPG